MLMILIDAGVLIGLVSLFQEEELSLGLAAVLAFITAIVTWGLVYGLVQAMGPAGLYVGLLVAAALLGVALSALFGMELKRAIMVAGIFMAVHFVLSLALASMTKVPAAAAVVNWQCCFC
jgi:hypothetical protein